MLRFLILVIAVAMFVPPVFAADERPDVLAQLKERIHYMPDGTPDTGLEDPMLGNEASDKTFLQLHPLDDITSIEIFVDQITMPAPLLTRMLALEPAGPYSSAGGKWLGVVKLASGASVPLSYQVRGQGVILIIGGRAFGLSSSLPKLPELPDDVKPSMTRAELEQHFKPDAGNSTPFHLEKYTMRDVYASEEEYLKLNVAFKPAGMTDAEYSLGKWVPPKTTPDDVLMRLSPLYPETGKGN